MISLIKTNIIKRLLLCISLVALLFPFPGCTTLQYNSQMSCIHEQELKDVRSQLELLASDLGVDREQSKRETILGLISEIRIAIGNEKIYQGETLSEEEKETVSSYLNYKQKILDTIFEQDQFIRSIKHKRMILLPNRE